MVRYGGVSFCRRFSAPPKRGVVWCVARHLHRSPRCHHVPRDERPIEPSRNDARQQRFAFGAAEERSGQFDLKRFMRLARGMGIPADDAARLAMNIVIEQRRENDPSWP